MSWQIRPKICFAFWTAGSDGLFQRRILNPHNLIGRNRDVWQYLDGVAASNPEMKNEGCARRFLRNLLEIYSVKTMAHVEKTVRKLLDYFLTQYPGGRDPRDIQRLKGMCREWEAECLWGYYGWKCDNVNHLRLGFYTGDIFTPQPTQKRDSLPSVRYLEKIKPEVISVALDPEASGPDTHYKVLQAISEARRFTSRKASKRRFGSGGTEMSGSGLILLRPIFRAGKLKYVFSDAAVFCECLLSQKELPSPVMSMMAHFLIWPSRSRFVSIRP